MDQVLSSAGIVDVHPPAMLEDSTLPLKNDNVITGWIVVLI
jgi:hypothetical protein